MTRRRIRYSGHCTQLDSIVVLWLLRMLVPLEGQREFLHANGFSNDSLAETLGLGHWIDPEKGDFDLKAVRSEVRSLHQKAEKQSTNAVMTLPPCLQHNVAQLSALVGLSPTDCRVLEFAVTLNNERLLDDTADWLGPLSSSKVFHALSIILAIPEHDIRRSLSAQGILASSGLVSIDRCGNSLLRSKLDLLTDAFADSL